MSSKLKENLSWSLYLCKDVKDFLNLENFKRNWKFWFVKNASLSNSALTASHLPVFGLDWEKKTTDGGEEGGGRVHRDCPLEGLPEEHLGDCFIIIHFY